jgi:2-polyprenyl-3-methyl-5-hydroxy-6-metoxy-1,4-benzoquinol methylase
MYDYSNQENKTIPPHHRYVFKSFQGSSHNWAIQQIKHIVNSKITDLDCFKSLDVGSGSGMMGQFLKDLGIKKNFAIEIDAQAREYGSSIYAKCVSSIDELGEDQFDLILLMDILEHLIEPQNYLSEVVKLLKTGGTVIISVPNITHWSIRLSILFGSFKYTERGILDKTHLHFFTRQHLKNMVLAINTLEINCLTASISPVELLIPKKWHNSQSLKYFSNIRQTAIKFWPELAGYQHLLSATKL